MEPLVLRFTSGRYATAEFPVPRHEPIVIGRAAELDMVLNDDDVSAQHARITVIDDHVWIEDLQSANGTFVNGAKIGRLRLQVGDRVIIGRSAFELQATTR
jgi:pSer/pThr/pTyr-binding forkhead associated (FHA) protein